jgi:hypothetical protein
MYKKNPTDVEYTYFDGNKDEIEYLNLFNSSLSDKASRPVIYVWVR